MRKLRQFEIEKLRNQLIEWNNLYRQGNPEVSDTDYDLAVEMLRENSPEDEFFKKAVIEQPSERMEPLPLPMYSLEKIKTVKALRKWFQKMLDAGAVEIIATPKFDGISLIVDEEAQKAWTRGDGVEGQRSDKHYANMNSVSSDDQHCSSWYTWGEAIMKKITFAQLKDKEDFPYKNARNMVAGLFNAENGNESPFISKVNFVRYGCDKALNKDEQLERMREIYGEKAVAASKGFYIEELLDLTDKELNEFLDIELHDDFDDEYCIDGVVLEVNEYEVRAKLGRLNNGNPAYAIAFKKEEWCSVYQTRVTGIELGVGKTGVINPVILVEPVEINGATVSRVTGYNMAYMFDNRICKGALIEITRGGEVIPKHLKTISFNNSVFEQFMDDVIICPSCGEILKWDTTQVNMVCPNENCKERTISSLVYFFKTMGCEKFSDPTVRKIYDAGFVSLDSILDLELKVFQQLLGKVAGKTVYDQIQKVLVGGVPLARYLTAINVFDGKIAETTCQKILNSLDHTIVECLAFPEEFVLCAGMENNLMCEIQLIPGIGEVLARSFVRGLERYLSIGKNKKINIIYVRTPKVEPSTEMERLFVCFTGFRDKELENALTAKGHVVLNGVTKECTLLVVKDLNSNSSKMDTARKRGLRIVDREEFINEIFLSR